MNQNCNQCLESTKLWQFIYKYNTINKTKLVLNPQQRYQLCLFINGKLFNRKILNSIFQKNYKKN